MHQPRPFRTLVICTGIRARSQMAHGWLRHLGGQQVEVESAGVEPKGVHPLAIQVMAEVGIDLSGHTSDYVGQYAGQHFDLVLTVCDSAREKCPFFPGSKHTLHQNFEDPDRLGLTDDELFTLFIRIRDEIGDFSRQLLSTELKA